MLQRTTAQKKIAKLKKRVRVVRGGTSASKTFSIIPFLIDYAVSNSFSEISIVAETIPHLRRGAMRDFLKIMEMVGLYNDSQFNKSSLTYTFLNGSFIEFFSADQPSKLRGARRDILFVNECNNITWEAYHQMAIRTRKFIYLDYNPVSEFWVDTELIGDLDTDYVVLTYKDNEALDLSIIKEIEKAREKAQTSDYWANWWKVYGLGEVGSLQGVVFNNWKQIDHIPNNAKLDGYGLDFGYTNDPTTLIAVYYMDGCYYLDQLIYRTGMTNQDIFKECKGVVNGIVYADSAEPKSIEELRRLGLKIKPAEKGRDSIMHGIQQMQAEKFFVTSRSLDLIKELRSYTWDEDKTGRTLNKPIDDFNHAIDAVRYFFTSKNKKKGNYQFGNV